MVVNIITDDFESFYEIQDDLGRFVELIFFFLFWRLFSLQIVRLMTEEEWDKFHHHQLFLEQTINRKIERQKNLR